MNLCIVYKINLRGKIGDTEKIGLFYLVKQCCLKEAQKTYHSDSSHALQFFQIAAQPAQLKIARLFHSCQKYFKLQNRN